ncbi:MAG: hypothetical protein Q3993_01890 [Filifactor alocis]|nr:hypothetical protein [Filifactor alocis]
MKKTSIKTILLTGIVVVASLGGGMIKSNAEPKALPKTVPAQTSSAYKSLIVGKEPKLEDLLKEFNFLTDNEKQRLLASEDKVKSQYEKLDVIDKKINIIYDNVFKKAGSPDKKLEEIAKRNKPLWDKLYKHLTKEQNEARGIEDFIRKSPALTKKEKELLLQDELLIKKMQAEVSAAYENAQKLIKPLDDEALAIEAEIKKIDEQNKDVWDKVFLHPSDNNSAIVYDKMLR